MRPLGLKIAIAVEDLDAVVLSVGHIHVTVAVCRDVMNDVELSRSRARAAPGHDRFAVCGVLVNPGISVPVRHEQVSIIRVRGDVCASIKRRTAI